MDFDTIDAADTEAVDTSASHTHVGDANLDTRVPGGMTKEITWCGCRPVGKGVTLPEVGARMTARVFRILHPGVVTVVLPGGIHALLSHKHYSWVEKKVDLSKRLKIGQEIDVVVRKLDTRANGRTRVKVSHRLTRPNPWEEIDQEHPAGSRTMGQITNWTETGAWVELETGYPAFVSNGEMGASRKRPWKGEKPEVGTWIELVIRSANAEMQMIVASHRRAMSKRCETIDPPRSSAAAILSTVSVGPALSASDRQTLDALWQAIDELHPAGSRCWGAVEKVATYGIFVKLESGLSALVPWAEAAWILSKRQPRPAFAMGDRLEVVILSTDKEKARIRASHRLTLPNPLEAFAAEYPVGSALTGTVQEVVNFGAFVRLAGGVVGLLHASKMRPEAVLNAGDAVNVRIVDCNPEAGRIGLAEIASEATAFASEATDFPSEATAFAGQEMKRAA